MKMESNRISKKHQNDVLSDVLKGGTYFWDSSDLRNAILCFSHDDEASRLNDFVKMLLENPGVQSVTEQASDETPVLHDLVPTFCELLDQQNENVRRNQIQSLCSTLTLFSTSKCLLEETFHCLARLDISSNLEENSSLKYFQKPSSCIKAVYALQLYQVYHRSRASRSEGSNSFLIEKIFTMTKILSESCTISQVLVLMTAAPVIQKHLQDLFYIDENTINSYDLIGDLDGMEKEAMISLVELMCAHVREHTDFIQRVPVSLLVLVAKIHFPLAKTIVNSLIEDCAKKSNRSKEILVDMCRSDSNIHQLCQDLIQTKKGTKQLGSL